MMLPLGAGTRAARSLVKPPGAALRATAGRASLRQAHSKAGSGPVAVGRKVWYTVAGAGTVGALSLWLSRNQIHLDSPASQITEVSRKLLKAGRKDEEKIAATAPAARTSEESLSVYAWGSNTYRVVAPDLDGGADIRIPRPIPALDGVALRDLWLGETHGAAIDAQGDLIQWGTGFFYPESRLPGANIPSFEGPLNPIKTLSGKKLRKIVGTEGKLYALTASGEVLVVGASRASQPVPGHRHWSTLGMTSSPASQVEYTRMKGPLSYFESFIDLAAGHDHLLALTNKGRILAAPSNTFGNAFGQLAYRRVIVSDAYAAAPVTAPSLNQDPSAPKLDDRETFAPLPPPEGPPLPQGQSHRAFEPRMYELEDFLEREGALTLANLLPTWAQTPEQLQSGAGMVKPSRSTHPAARELIARTEEGRNLQNDLKTARNVAREEAQKEAFRSAQDINFCTDFGEIPSLRGIPMQAIAAGQAHSVALTKDGKVLSWGANLNGQCGFLSGISSRPATSVGYFGLTQRHAYSMDAAMTEVDAAGPRGSSSECVPVPTQVDLVRAVGEGRGIKCTGIRAAGENTFFFVSSAKTVKNPRGDQFVAPVEELYVSGKGQHGTLGNGGYALTTGCPVRVKGVSGRSEYNEKLNASVPIKISGLTIGPDGHAAATIIASGRHDLLVWGTNLSYQLGDGRRSNSALPHYLPPLASLPYLRNPPANAGEDEEDNSPMGAGDMSILRPTKAVTDSEMLKLVSQPPLEKYRFRANSANFTTGSLAGQAVGVTQAQSQRLQLAAGARLCSRVPADGANKDDWRKKVNASQDIFAGPKSSALFWRID